MASVTKDPNGRHRITFTLNGKRPSLRIGRTTPSQADAIKLRVEALLAARDSGVIPPDTAAWLASLSDKAHQRLARLGLVSARPKAANVTLAGLLDRYFGTLDVKSGTRTTYAQARRSLEARFGVTKSIAAITTLDADEWRQALLDEGLADATVSKRVKVARAAFRRAVRWGMIPANPFEGVKAGAMTNTDRQRFITREQAEAVLAACPDAEWRLLFALSRFGGLRCPSETLSLTWADVDWDRGRIRVPSPKTARQGKSERVIPLFPELRPLLLDAFEQAAPGAEHVITRYRSTSANLRTQLNRIIRRAGLAPWPRPFHNLRASAQTELAARFPGHVVCGWLGNSEAVAQAHYLQIRESDFAAALAESPAQKAAQNPTRAAAPTSPNKPHASNRKPQKQRKEPLVAAPCASSPSAGMTPWGFEPQFPG